MVEGENLLTKEELDALNKDVAAIKSSIETDKMKEVKEEARKEAEKEFELKKRLEDQERLNKELQAKLESQAKESVAKIELIQKKVDELATSKAPMRMEDPFKSVNQNSEAFVNKLTDEQVDAIEEKSKELFFKETY